MVMGTVALDFHDDRVVGTLAHEFATSKVRIARGYAIINSWWIERDAVIDPPCAAEV
jgi:hypothetical protein